MKKDQDEFNQAFMAEEAGAEPMADDVDVVADPDAAGDDMADPALNADDAGLEGEQNAPTDSAAEGLPSPTSGDTAAVTLAEGADEGASTEDAKPVDYEQKYKTLQGKYNAEMQRMKDKLAALESAAGQPVMQAKDGAKVEGEDWNRLEATPVREDVGGEPGARRTAAGVLMEDGDGRPVAYAESKDDADAKRTADLFNDAPKVKLAEGGEVDEADAVPDAGGDIVARISEDYGADFVQDISGLITQIAEQRARAIVEQMGGEFAGGVEEKIEKIVELSAQGLGRLHRSVLLSMRKDAEGVVNSPEFGEWVASLPDEERAKAEAAIDDGDLPDLLALFEQYDGREDGEQSPDDVWAEGAAAGVKGSAPIRLPARAPASDDDEYKRAWESM